MRLACALLGAAALLLPGCQSPVLHLGVALFYDAAPLGDTRVERDLRYRRLDSDATREASSAAILEADPFAHKHSLDLFVPSPAAVDDPKGWPLLVFVHGGGWAWGDRQYAVGRADVYGNVGRYFASQGIGTAVISYRLQPDVQWYEQVDDVGAAVAFLQREVGSHGGNPSLVFLSGHSAGAHLGMRLALDPAWLARLGIPRASICGLLPVSGAAYDLADDETYRLGASRSYFEGRFAAPPEGADPASVAFDGMNTSNPGVCAMIDSPVCA